MVPQLHERRDGLLGTKRANELDQISVGLRHPAREVAQRDGLRVADRRDAPETELRRQGSELRQVRRRFRLADACSDDAVGIVKVREAVLVRAAKTE